MSKVNGVATKVGLITIAAGMFAGILPKTWIELSFRADPDRGNGILELLFALALVAVGVMILFDLARRCSGAKTAVRHAVPLRHSDVSPAITLDSRA